MSILTVFGRPWVTFDAGNKQHRAWFADFQKFGTWGRCPVRFIVSEDYRDLLSMINHSLIDFYVSNEFKTQKQPAKQ